MMFTSTITKITRLTNSPAGNPRFSIRFEGIPTPFHTKTNAMFAYEITSGMEGKTAVVKVERNRIVDLSV